MIQNLKHRYQFEPEFIKNGSPGERTDFRSSHFQMFFKKDVIKNFRKLNKKASLLGLYLIA